MKMKMKKKKKKKKERKKVIKYPKTDVARLKHSENIVQVLLGHL